MVSMGEEVTRERRRASTSSGIMAGGIMMGE
jgi:hypothetical protein